MNYDPNIASSVANAFVQSPAFVSAMDAVEARARAGVVAETRANATTLMLLALAGGAVGGYVFKGRVGLIAAVLVGLWAVDKLSTGSTNPMINPQPGAAGTSTNTFNWSVG